MYVCTTSCSDLPHLKIVLKSIHFHVNVASTIARNKGGGEEGSRALRDLPLHKKNEFHFFADFIGPVPKPMKMAESIPVQEMPADESSMVLPQHLYEMKLEEDWTILVGLLITSVFTLIFWQGLKPP